LSSSRDGGIFGIYRIGSGSASADFWSKFVGMVRGMIGNDCRVGGLKDGGGGNVPHDVGMVRSGAVGGF